MESSVRDVLRSSCMIGARSTKVCASVEAAKPSMTVVAAAADGEKDDADDADVACGLSRLKTSF